MGDRIRFGTVDTGFPRTAEELKEWLKVEAEVWKPHVRREFLDAIEPMAGLIWEDVDERMRAEAMRDVRVRLRNEQRKLFNHIRRGEVLAILRRRWKRDKEA